MKLGPNDENESEVTHLSEWKSSLINTPVHPHSVHVVEL